MPGKSQIFKETLAQRIELLDEQAVWLEAIEHLSMFLDTDAAPAKQGIRTKSERLVVPQEVIHRVIDHIKEKYIEELQRHLDAIERSEVLCPTRERRRPRKQQA